MIAFFTGMAVCVPELMAGEAGGPQQSQAGSDETRLWSYPTRGWVDTAPAVVDGVVYVGSADGMVHALDAADGSERWSFATGDAVKSTPTVADGVVYVGSNDNRVYALDAQSGDELWSHDTGTWVQYSPPVADGLVYVSSLSDGDWKVHALDGSSGKGSGLTRCPTVCSTVSRRLWSATESTFQGTISEATMPWTRTQGRRCGPLTRPTSWNRRPRLWREWFT